ncbi:MAG: ABC transporter ATP-binding protein, partial [Anaerolineae bacterium]|nr:ABC transporter ATP-binding protein [Anaerolineae bacterium]
MTALDYLMYMGEIRGIKNRKSKAQDVLQRVGLAHRANSQIRTLSKGMRQRVGLAQALIHDPEVVILDEPTIGLDPIQVLELRDLIGELRQNHTVLFSTHILSEAEQVCDRVIIIKQGEIVGQGTPGELREELERGGRVLVRVDAAADQVIPTLEQLQSVTQVHATSEGIVCTPRSVSVDPRPEIARAIIGNNWNLIELRPLAVNLEEIFIELTRQQVREVVTDTEPTVG